MNNPLDTLLTVVQEDAGGRGLQADPVDNLITATPHDFAAACRSLADCPAPWVAILTGFYIPSATPPAAETDGPLGAIFLARALVPLGAKVFLAAEEWCLPALRVGLEIANPGPVELLPLPLKPPANFTASFGQQTGPLTHLISIERVGPSHTPASLQRQGASPQTVEKFCAIAGPEHHDRCHNMRGRDISEWTSPAHLLFESTPAHPPVTIGIGDGGNELGMGKIPWQTIERNISGGGLIACRVPVDHLIVAGVSNWGAYALAAGVLMLRREPNATLFDPDREEAILKNMVERGPLVDGKLGVQQATVDGLPFTRHARVLQDLERILQEV